MQTNLSIAPEHLSETIPMMDHNQGRAQAVCPIFGTPSRHNFTSLENFFFNLFIFKIRPNFQTVMHDLYFNAQKYDGLQYINDDKIEIQ